MEDNTFTELAKLELEKLFTIFDIADKNSELEIDFSGEVVKIDSTLGCHVINRNIAAKEIWLSSPESGPHHFRYMNDRWVTSSGIELYSLLKQEFSKISVTL